MLVKTAAAPQTVTDLGEFEAVISSGSIDRQHDIVEPVGMVRALRLWGERPIPLVWDHGRDPHDVIGSVDGRTARQVGHEVVVAGRVDLDSDRGRQVFKLMKRRTMAFSFGFMATRSRRRPGGKGRVISAVDIFEVTATSTPANPSTRVLSTKGEDVAGLFCEVVMSRCPPHLVGTAYDRGTADLTPVRTLSRPRPRRSSRSRSRASMPDGW
jgi:HK97 family phage prohead protease